MNEKMQAWTYTQYGTPDVLSLQTVKKPVPNNDEVLIEVRAVSLNRGDLYALLGSPAMLRMSMGLLRPKQPVLGNDVAGRIIAVGRNVSGFQIGDEVYGESGLGAFAEYATVPQEKLALKPANLSFEQAAAVPVAGSTAMLALGSHGDIQAGQAVLIHGGSGGVGTFAVQIAKAFGAEVTAVCSTNKKELMRRIGADHVIDYTQQDFATMGKKYDWIFGINGERRLADYGKALTETGTYVCVGGTMRQIFGSMLFGSLRSRKSGKSFTNMGVAYAWHETLKELTILIEQGKVMPVVDGCYAFAELPQAFWALKNGRTHGKIVVSYDESNRS